jgi:predicted ferric reductase
MVQQTLRLVGHGGAMVSGKVSEKVSGKVTFGRVSAAGISWAAWVAGIGMGITIAMQVSTLHMHDINTVYGAVLSLSRLAALMGTYLSVIGIFLIARIPAVEKSIGHDQLVIWHRNLGPWSLYLIGAHFLLVVVGYAGQDQMSLAREIWRMLNDFAWMWWALAGFVLMVMAGITSYKKARAKYSYETWWMLHVLTYGAVASAFMHQIQNGQMFIEHPLNRAYWIGLYAVMAFSVVLWRFALPVARSLRHGLRVESIIQESPGVYSVIMKGRNLVKLGAEGGQFFEWRFLTRGHFLVAHPYSLSAAPTARYLRITVKSLGDHSTSLAAVKVGTRVFVEGPYGAFRAGQATKARVVLIGGGIGVTPVRALLDEFKDSVQIDFIYRASREEDLALKGELDQIAAQSGGFTRVHYMVGSRREHPMDAAHLLSVVPTVRQSDIYICGPKPLVTAVVDAARELGMSADRVHHEEFEFHKTVVHA